jgi:drug/metabolite transporter (DMT)-like permease
LVAIALGFLGVLIVVRPGANLAVVGVLLVIAAAFCNASYQTLTRAASRAVAPVPVAQGDKPNEMPIDASKTGAESVGTQLLYSGLVGTIVLTAALPFWWSSDWLATVTPTLALVFLSVGVMGGLGHLLLIRAYSLAPASTLAPWMYVQLLWSVGLGWLVFGQTPDGITVIGMLLIGLSPQLTRLNRWHDIR